MVKRLTASWQPACCHLIPPSHFASHQLACPCLRMGRAPTPPLLPSQSLPTAPAPEAQASGPTLLGAAAKTTSIITAPALFSRHARRRKSATFKLRMPDSANPDWVALPCRALPRLSTTDPILDQSPEPRVLTLRGVRHCQGAAGPQNSRLAPTATVAELTALTRPTAMAPSDRCTQPCSACKLDLNRHEPPGRRPAMLTLRPHTPTLRWLQILQI